ncbi:MAG: family transposase [Polaromonas sp.]|nr:family transposase [Polaromonas sp.]
MVIIYGLMQPLEAVGKRITTRNDSSRRLKIKAYSVVDQAVYPQCAWTSSRVHGHCQRCLADCPCLGQPVTLEIEVGRFKCVNRHCPQRIFCEQIDILAAPKQRRTLRLSKNSVLAWLRPGRGAAASCLGAHLGIRISGSTVLRELLAPVTAPAIDWH